MAMGSGGAGSEQEDAVLFRRGTGQGFRQNKKEGKRSHTN
uniref:Uncharacterized protein n=1 Tax=Peromyscus maniculatus bairdii TaxID=230844 RepID=A0A8C8U319_PERMB